MRDQQWWAPLAFLAAFGAIGYVAARGVRRRRRRRPLRVNPRPVRYVRRVYVDKQGKLARGWPPAWPGTRLPHVRELGRDWRQIERTERDCETAAGVRRARRFRSSEAAVAELLDANPELFDFLQAEGHTRTDMAYLDWLERRRRSARHERVTVGRKPELAAGDGRFDAINELLDLKGKRRVSSWQEAVRVVMPPSRRWRDVAGRLPALEDATGLRLNLPGPAEQLERARAGLGDCLNRADEGFDQVVGRARAARGAPRLEASPF